MIRLIVRSLLPSLFGFIALCSLSCGDCGHVLAPEAPAIILSVWDSETHEPLGRPLSAIAILDDRVMEFGPPDGNFLHFFGPPGWYDIFVAKEGYSPFYQAKVHVPRSKCYTETTTVQAYLDSLVGPVPVSPTTWGQLKARYK